MTKKLSQLILIVALSFLISVASLFMLAQRGNLPLRVVALSSEGIRFYANDANGALQAIGEPLSNFGVEVLGGNAEWLIYSQDNFAASPNGNFIAFTAKRADESALFVYTVGDQSLKQIPIEFYSLQPSWSPDSEAILLKPGSPYLSDIPMPNDFVYELASDSLLQITFTESHETFQWSPDGDSLIYLGWCHPEPCGNPTSELYWLNRDGSNRFPITDFPTQLPPNTYIDACHLAWFPDTQRWYYVVGCGGSLENPRTYIYSTNLNADNRLELDVEEYLKSTDGDEITMHYGTFEGIEARSDGIYITVELAFYPETEAYPGVEQVPLLYQLRVLRLSAQGQLDLIQQQDLWDFAGPVISPDGRHMALRHDSAVIVDLANNQNPLIVPALSGDSDMAICDIRWLNNESIVYNVGGHQCYFSSVVEAKEVWRFNIATNELEVLTEGLGDYAWLIPSLQD